MRLKFAINQFTIKQRLLAGFGIMVIVTALATGTGWWAARNASENMGALIDGDMPLLLKANHILNDLKDTRLEELHFLHQHDPEAFEKAKAHIASIQTILHGILEQLTEKKSRAQVQSALEQLSRYGKGLANVVDLQTQRGLSEKEGLKGKLRKAVHEVEAMVKEQGLAELTVLMLMCRRHEKDYLLRGDEKYLGQISQRIKEFEERMKMIGMADDNRQKLRNLFERYYSGMAAIVEIDKKIKTALATMDHAAAALQNSVTATDEAAQAGISTNGKAVLSGLAASQSFLMVILGGAVTLGTIVGLLITRTITKPIGQILFRLKDIAQGDGDLTTRLTVSGRDELGELARDFNVFVEKLQTMIQDIAKNAATLAEASTEMSAISTQMSAGAQQTSGKSNAVASAAEEMSANFNSVAAAMEQATTNMSLVASSTEQVTASVNEISQNSEKAQSITNQAVTKATHTMEKVNGLGKAAKAISKVTEVITEISEQTNLLALNATIEAARAGEAGKGFAVVANEIKELAKQTADATMEIKNQIEGVQQSTGETVTDIEEISGVINNVDEIVSTIAAAVEEQSVAMKEIAGNIAQASSGIMEVNQNITQSSQATNDIAQDISEVNQAASEMTNSSSQVNVSADELSGLAEQINSMVGSFKV